MTLQTFHLPDPLSVDVPDAELARLLGWPRNRSFDEATTRLVNQARVLFSQVARPWHSARQCEIMTVDNDLITLGSTVRLEGAALSVRARRIEAEAAVVFAVTAGNEVVQRINQIGEFEPDLAFVLASFASAFVERSLARMHELLCGWTASLDLAVANPLSPGNEGWALSAQHALFRIIAKDGAGGLPISLLPTGAISPAPSLLAISLLTRRVDLVQSDPHFRPCVDCSLRGCAYRRAAFVPKQA